MSESDTPVADMIERLLSLGIVPGTAIVEGRKVERALARDSALGIRNRERERLKKQRQRAALKTPVSGPNVPANVPDIESSIHPKTQSPKKKTDSPRPGPGDDWPADHEAQFWANVPRKVDKLDAMRALGRVRRTGIAWAVFLAAVIRWRAEAAGKEARYVKHPATWLNKGSYLNEEQHYDERRRQDRPIDTVAAAAARVFGRGGRHGPAPGAAGAAPPANGMGDEHAGKGGGGQPAFDLDLKPGPDGVFRR